jgi:tRNA pseudouridine(55) synthase
MERYVVLDKREGETPLECVEAWRKNRTLPPTLPLAYAGRLDPMASGKLLVLIGEECKAQTAYHRLDKEYQVQILLGIGSDTGDILGTVREAKKLPEKLEDSTIRTLCRRYRRQLTLPYPIYSAKPVAGKPLHVWASEGRIREINIPTYEATIYRLYQRGEVTTISRDSVCRHALQRIELPTTTVADGRKTAGNDFRREAVRAAWKTIKANGQPDDPFYLVTITCTASSGMYMRTLSELIARDLGTEGLAYRIIRTKIGRYQPLLGTWGFWRTRFTSRQ